MAFLNCGECGWRCAEDVQACPKCGSPRASTWLFSSGPHALPPPSPATVVLLGPSPPIARRPWLVPAVLVVAVVLAYAAL